MPSLNQSSQRALMEQAKSEIPVKERRYLLRSYKDTFLGKDLVSWIQKNVVSDLESALVYGRIWQKEFKWFEHICNEHLLENQSLMYRWIDNRKVARSSSLDCAAIYPLGNCDSDEKIWLDFENGVSEIFPNLDVGVVVQNLLRSGNAIVVKNRSSMFVKTKKKCFVGSEATDWMEDKLLLSRPEAVSLGQFMIDSGYIRHVNDSKDFYDAEHYYTDKKALNQSDEIPFSLDFGYDNFGTPVLLNYCIDKLLSYDSYKTKGIFRLSVQTSLLERVVLLIGCCTDGGISVLEHLKGDNLPLIYASLIKIFFMKLDKPPLPKNILTDSLIPPNIDDINDKSNILEGISKEISKIPGSMGLLSTLLLLQKVGISTTTCLNYNDLAKLFVPCFFRIDSKDIKNYMIQNSIATSFLTLLISEVQTIYGLPKV